MTVGKLIRKTHPHHAEVLGHMRAIHLAASPAMKELLTLRVGEEWDKWHAADRKGYTLMTLWNEYHTEPFNTYSVGTLTTRVPVMLPNNNCIESWHKRLTQVLKGMMRANTTKVLTASLPLLVEMDGQMPKQLSCTAEYLPPKVLKKACKMARVVDNLMLPVEGMDAWTVLASKSKLKKITHRDAKAFLRVFKGKPPFERKTKKNKSLQVCNACTIFSMMPTMHAMLVNVIGIRGECRYSWMSAAACTW